MSSSRAIRAARAFVEIFGDDSKLRKTLKDAQARLQSFGKGLAAIGGGLLAAGGGIAAAFLKPISAASDLQETMNKFDVVFGERRAEVKAWSDDFAGAMGRSKTQIAAFLGNTQDLLIPIGFDESTATATSKQLTGLALDLASFNNMADADVLRDLHAALTGSGEVMKKYGVVVSEAAVKQELLNQKISPKKATEAEKAQARLNLILRGTTAAQGDTLRSATSWANMQKRLIALLEDSAASIGSAVLPMLEQLAGAVAPWLQALSEWIQKNPGIIKGVAMVGAGAAALGAALVAVGLAASATGTALGVVGGIVGLLLSPMGLLIGLAAALGVTFVKSGAAAGDALESLKATFQPLSDRAVAAFSAIKDALDAGEYKLAAEVLWLSLKEAFLAGIQPLREAWIGFKNSFLEVFDAMLTAGLRKWAEFQGYLASAIVELMAYFDDTINAEDVQRTLTEDVERRIRTITDDATARTDARDAQVAQEMTDLDRQLSAARAALAAARNEARTAADAAENTTESANDKFKDMIGDIDSATINVKNANVAAAPQAGDLRSVSGSGQLVALINRQGSLEERQVSLLSQVRTLQKELLTVTKNGPKVVQI